MASRTRLILAAGVLGLLEALLRLFFYYYEAVFAGVALLEPMPPASTMNLINSVNLILRVAGLIAISGLLLMTRWEYWEDSRLRRCLGHHGIFHGLRWPCPATHLPSVLLPRRTRYFAMQKTA